MKNEIITILNPIIQGFAYCLAIILGYHLRRLQERKRRIALLVDELDKVFRPLLARIETQDISPYEILHETYLDQLQCVDKYFDQVSKRRKEKLSIAWEKYLQRNPTQTYTFEYYYDRDDPEKRKILRDEAAMRIRNILKSVSVKWN